MHWNSEVSRQVSALGAARSSLFCATAALFRLPPLCRSASSSCQFSQQPSPHPNISPPLNATPVVAPPFLPNYTFLVEPRYLPSSFYHRFDVPPHLRFDPLTSHPSSYILQPCRTTLNQAFALISQLRSLVPTTLSNSRHHVGHNNRIRPHAQGHEG